MSLQVCNLEPRNFGPDVWNPHVGDHEVEVTDTLCSKFFSTIKRVRLNRGVGFDDNELAGCTCGQVKEALGMWRVRDHSWQR